MFAQKVQAHSNGRVRSATLHAHPGQLVALVGPNGSGKSTLLRAIAGLEKISGGKLDVAEPCCLLFQNPEHQVIMPSVAADVAVAIDPASCSSVADVRAVVHDSLDAVGLASMQQHRVNSLSGGQKQRLALAGALAQRPSVLLCDEITAFLDADDAGSVMQCVRDIATQHRTACVWASHRLDEALQCDAAVAFSPDGETIDGIRSPREAVEAVRVLSTSSHTAR